MKHLSLFFIASFLLLGFHSCVDNTIDEPPIKEFAELVPNATIADILAVYAEGQVNQITEDLIVDAVVVGNDISGNIYKSVFVEDETGGIQLSIDAIGLNSLMSVGRRVYIQAKDLYIGDFAALPQLGVIDADNEISRMPFTFVGDTEEFKIVLGERNIPVTPTVKSITALGSSDYNRLIKLENVQFAQSDLGNTYALPDGPNGQNRSVEDCDGNTVVLRNSDFSDFVAEVLPEGNGSLTAIYTTFNETRQLVIRDLNDVEFAGDRCDEVIIDVPDPNATIADLMALYSEGDVVNITSNLVVDAIVTADDATGNFYKQIVVEDETGAINIQIDAFDLYEKYEVGRRIVLKAQNLAIGDYNGLPQIGVDNGDQVGRIPEASYESSVIRGNFVGIPTPTTMTVSEAVSSSNYNSLIKINDVEFISGDLGSTFADGVNQQSANVNLSDCDDNGIILRTSGFSDFASVTVPEKNGSITAILSVFNGTRQLIIRNVSDINFNSDRCDGTGNPGDLEELNEDFSTVGNNTDVALTGWNNEIIKGVRKWRGKEFDGNTYIQATAFGDTEPEMETWVITPQVIMNGNNKLTFRSAMAFYEHDGLSVFISSDYNGNSSTATWEALSPVLAGSAQENYDWVDSGVVDLSAYNGSKIVIGFKYEGTGASNTTSYIIDDVVITK